MPRVVPKSTSPSVDPFFNVDRLRYGSGELARRRVAFHEALHVVVADAQGWYVDEVAITDAEHGYTRVTPPPGRSAAQVREEKLVFTLAPSVVPTAAERVRSSGDVQDCWELAREIAGTQKGWSPDSYCMLTSREINAVYAAAARTAIELAASPRSRAMSHAVREMLAKYGRLDRNELNILLGERKAKAPADKPERTAASRTAAKTTNGCRQCGHAYAPPHSSGKCGGCRGDL